MQALVMGGTEFISKNVAKYLISKRYSVDIFTRGVKPLTYQGVNAHITGDRLNIEDLRQGLNNKKYDFIFDMSAYTLAHVQNLLAVLDKTTIKRYVFCSSGAVYTPTTSLIDEAAERGENPNWGDYGLNKKEAEDYLFNLYKTSGFPIVIFRPTYVYGEENNLYREAFLFDRLLAELPIAIPDGTHTETQFLHIEDLVKIFERAAHTATAIGQAYNITHPERINWNLLLETAASIVNKRAKIVPATPAMLKMLNITARDFFPFRDVTYLLSIDKLEKSELPIPQVNLKQGLLRAYHWYAIVKPRLSDPKIDKLSLLLANLS